MMEQVLSAAPTYLIFDDTDFLLLSFFFSFALSEFVKGKFDVLLSAPVVLLTLLRSFPNKQLKIPTEDRIVENNKPLPYPKLKPCLVTSA